MLPVTEGRLGGGLPHLTMGNGPSLVVFSGFTPLHGNPAGATRRMLLAQLRTLSRRRRVHLIGRRVGVPPGASVADFADDYAAALAANFTAPVDIAGLSTGGAMALQLAADHPALVRRLIVAGAGHTWSAYGQRALLDWALRARAGRPPMRTFTRMVTPSPGLRPAASLLMWCNDRGLRGRDLSDGIVMATALAAFDCRERLGDITAPLLLVAGDRDPLLTADIIGRTVRGAAGAQLALYPRRGHYGIFLGGRLSREIEHFLGGDRPGPG